VSDRPHGNQEGNCNRKIQYAKSELLDFSCKFTTHANSLNIDLLIDVLCRVPQEAGQG
jgi:hypothetical protein